MSTATGEQRIGKMTYSTPSDHELVLKRSFDAPRRFIFDAWTSPKHLPNWMLGPGAWSMPVCELDLRPGGAWHFGWRKPSGEAMEMRGVYQDVSPPERLVSTESWGHPFPDTINTVALAEQDGRTAMTTTIRYSSKEARDAAMKTGMLQGVEKSYERLDEYAKGMK